MKKIYYILHGLGASPNNNWFPWLKNKLEQKGDIVIVPNLPNSLTPYVGDWLNTLRREIVGNGEGVLIGHSLGGVLAMKYIEAGGMPLKVVLIGTPFGLVEDIPEINSFFEKPIKLDDDIKNKIKFFILYSDNDPFNPLIHVKSWEKLLNTKAILIPNKAHFLQTEFPEILNYI